MDWLERLDRALKGAVSEAKEVGRNSVIAFSGGLDSSLLAVLLPDLPLYSVAVEGSEDGFWVVKAAEMIGRDVNLVRAEVSEDIVVSVMNIIESMNPLDVSLALPLYILGERVASDGYEYVITGQGADELFGGYWWYNDVVGKEGYLKLYDKLWEDLSLLYDDTLEREDKVTMTHSVEMRVPYLDRDVVRVAMRISPHLKIKNKNDSMRKWVHRRVASIIGLPDYIAYRDKDPAQSGCGIHEMIEEIAEDYFEGKKVEEVELDDKGSLYRYLDEDYGTPAALAYIEEVAKSLD